MKTNTMWKVCKKCVMPVTACVCDKPTDSELGGDCPASLPEHHVRYARAWALHQDADMPDSAREILEREMDSAQNLFGWDEFQAFKVTLPGFVKFWADWKAKSISLVNDSTKT